MARRLRWDAIEFDSELSELKDLLRRDHTLNGGVLFGLDGHFIEIQARAVEVLRRPEPWRSVVSMAVVGAPPAKLSPAPACRGNVSRRGSSARQGSTYPVTPWLLHERSRTTSLSMHTCCPTVAPLDRFVGRKESVVAFGIPNTAPNAASRT